MYELENKGIVFIQLHVSVVRYNTGAVVFKSPEGELLYAKIMIRPSARVISGYRYTNRFKNRTLFSFFNSYKNDQIYPYKITKCEPKLPLFILLLPKE